MAQKLKKINFINKYDACQLSKAIIAKEPTLSIQQVKKIIEKKDVKVNDKKISSDIMLNKYDSIVAYFEPPKNNWCRIVYDDANILIVFKYAGIEVVSETDRSLFEILKKDYVSLYAIHRIDRNTEGLVIFAKNHLSEIALFNAFKEHTIIKKYNALVKGIVKINKLTEVMYLNIDKVGSKAQISPKPKEGYQRIVSKFKLLKNVDKNSLLEVEIVTGRTHQIRAHLAYFGHPIVGDGKYGVQGEDKLLCLTATNIKFNFEKDSRLFYLNEKEIEAIPTWLSNFGIE